MFTFEKFILVMIVPWIERIDFKEDNDYCESHFESNLVSLLTNVM